jgi:uncharacterized protein YdeI (YjbR/CyaY-like superfamily)
MNRTDLQEEMFHPQNRLEWREWLQEHHDKKSSIWLIYHKKKANTLRITWSEAVDEALCFGWIDSKSKPIDNDRYMQFFSRRKPNSVWSKINKAKVQRLTEEGLMTRAGLDVVAHAKRNGSWTALDEIEELIIPEDLQEEFRKRPVALSYFLSLSRSDKRNILQWVVLAKKAETRSNRITRIVDCGDLNMKPNQF